MCTTPSHALSCVLGLAVAAAAQVPEAQSIFTTAPHALSVGPGHAVDAGVVAIHAPDPEATGGPEPYQPHATTDWPDYRPEVMFPDPAVRAVVDIDAMSTGNDYLPGTGAIIGPLPNAWLGATWSVTTDSDGVDPSPVFSRHAGPSGPGGDLYSYVFTGSEGVPAGIVDEPRLAQTAEQIGIDQPSAEMDGHDLFIPQLLADPTIAQVFESEVDTFYFSLTHASALAVPPSWWTAGPASGGAILVMQWTGTMWDPPEVYRTLQDLVGAAGLGADLDALAIDGRHPQPRILFSLDYATSAPLSQLLITGPGAVAVAAKDELNRSVVDRLRLRTDDDVDAICVYDPSVPTFAVTHGLPFLLPTANPAVAGSLHRLYAPGAAIPASVVVSLSGWAAGPEKGKVQYWARIGAAAPFLAHTEARAAGDHTFIRALPLPVGGPAGGSGVPLEVLPIFVPDANPLEQVWPHPLRIQL